MWMWMLAEGTTCLEACEGGWWPFLLLVFLDTCSFVLEPLASGRVLNLGELLFALLKMKGAEDRKEPPPLSPRHVYLYPACSTSSSASHQSIRHSTLSTDNKNLLGVPIGRGRYAGHVEPCRSWS